MTGAPPQLLVATGDRAALAQRLLALWRQGATAAIAVPEEQGALQAALPAVVDPAWGPAVVLGSGGSLGARHWCLQPLAHLQAAAAATATWLRQQGLDPATTELFNPLPLQHVSGLMPLVRAQAWGVPLRWLAPQSMREPAQLLRQAPPRPGTTPLLSLVPTQLQRLLEQPEGVAWLRGFALIWVGGAALPEAVAEHCRRSASWRGRRAAVRRCPMPGCGFSPAAMPWRSRPPAWPSAPWRRAAWCRCPSRVAGGAAAIGRPLVPQGSRCWGGWMGPSRAAVKPCSPSRWNSG